VAHVLPPEFTDLEPFSGWAIHSEQARFAKRLATPMDEIQAFYDAAMEHIDEALDYLGRYDLQALPDEGQRLLWLYCSLVTASFAVECWRQPYVPDAGASNIDATQEPAI